MLFMLGLISRGPQLPSSPVPPSQPLRLRSVILPPDPSPSPDRDWGPPSPQPRHPRLATPSPRKKAAAIKSNSNSVLDAIASPALPVPFHLICKSAATYQSAGHSLLFPLGPPSSTRANPHQPEHYRPQRSTCLLRGPSVVTRRRGFSPLLSPHNLTPRASRCLCCVPGCLGMDWAH